MLHPTILFLLTNIASTTGFIVACIITLFFLFLRRRRKNALVFLITALGLIVSTTLLKNLFQVARPPNGLIEATGYAFPSGHASGAMFLGLVICLLSRTQAKPARNLIYTLTLLMIFIIGMSRVVYGVHTPLQILAGFLLGLLWAFIFFKFATKNKVTN